MKRDQIDKLVENMKEARNGPIITKKNPLLADHIEFIEYYYDTTEYHFFVVKPLYIFDDLDKQIIIDRNGVIHEFMRNWFYRRLVMKEF